MTILMPIRVRATPESVNIAIMRIFRCVGGVSDPAIIRNIGFRFAGFPVGSRESRRANLFAMYTSVDESPRGLCRIGEKKSIRF